MSFCDRSCHITAGTLVSEHAGGLGPSFFSTLCQECYSWYVRKSLRVLCLSGDCDHCVHLFDQSSTRGRELVRMKSNTYGSGLSIYFSASPGSAIGSLAYGFWQELPRQWDFACVQFFPLSTMQLSNTVCPTCHLSYFTPSRIALCPPIPVLQYINDYVSNTPIADQLPLHEVCTYLSSNHNDFKTVRCSIYFVHATLPTCPTHRHISIFSLWSLCRLKLLNELLPLMSTHNVTSSTLMITSFTRPNYPYRTRM